MHISEKTTGIRPVSPVSATAEMMAEAASVFMASLSDEQRNKSVYRVNSEERSNWSYLPKKRAGVALFEMDKQQQKLALALLATGLSRRAYVQALGIMSLERVLREMEQSEEYDPDRFYVTIFGTPSGSSPWGWRVEGHHISINFLIVEGSEIAVTPNFLGANPAMVTSGNQKGFRVLPAEEDYGRRLLLSLDPFRRSLAVIAAHAPADIVTRREQRVRMDAPVGISVSRMSEVQRNLLFGLLSVYTSRMPEKLADVCMERIEKDGFGHIHFAWAGADQPGMPHYYRLHGPGFLVEYDNTQNNANHIHTVWRDFRNDWGDDSLKAHYERAHRGQ
jgi:hypothetical protein